MKISIVENRKLSKICACFFFISALFSLFCLRIMPLPSGLRTDLVFLQTADKSVFYNAFFLNPNPILWGVTLILCGALVLRANVKAYKYLSGLLFIISAASLIYPISKAAFDDYFMTVIIEGFALSVSTLFLFLTVAIKRFRVLPCKILIGIMGALIIYAIYECICYKYYLMLSDSIAVSLIAASLMIMAFTVDKKKEEKNEEEYDYE